MPIKMRRARTLRAMPMLCGSFLALGSPWVDALPSVAAQTTRTNLNFVFAPAQLNSICGSDLFGIEARSFGLMWFCAQPEPTSSVLYLSQWGYLDGINGRIVRGPTAQDPSIVFCDGQNFVRLDPLTLGQSVIGTLSPAVDTVNAGTVFDLLPSGQTEILLNTASDFEIRTFPQGTLVRSLTGQPWSGLQAERVIPGHFRTATSTQLAILSDKLYLYDANTLALLSTIALTYPGFPAGKANWGTSGTDELYAMSGSGSYLLSAVTIQGLSTTIRNFGMSGDMLLEGAAPISWQTGHEDLLGLWMNVLRVVDPSSGTVLYTQPLNNPLLGTVLPFAIDYDGDGKQDALWVYESNLYLLRNGGSVQELQPAVTGFYAAGLADVGTLVEADQISSDYNQGIEIVTRDPQTLTELTRRADAATADSDFFVGHFDAQPTRTLLSASESRISLENVTDGSSVWENDNDYFVSGNTWSRFAVVPDPCVNACRRLLVASNAQNSASNGSYLALFDTATGANLWQGPLQGGLGAGYTGVALGDLNGDGVPDLVSAWPDYMATSSLVAAIDGATFQPLWSTSIYTLDEWGARVKIAGIGHHYIGMLAGNTVHILDPADGHLVASRDFNTDAWSLASGAQLQYVPLSSMEGVWFILTGGKQVQWLNSDLGGDLHSLSLPGVTKIAAGGDGTVFASGSEGVFRLQIPLEEIFHDSFGD